MTRDNQRPSWYKRKVSIWLILVAGALPLLAYGGVLIIGAIRLGGRLPGEDNLSLILSSMFIYGAVIYPLVYGICVWVAKSKLRQSQNDAAFFVAIIPWGYFVLLGLLCGFYDLMIQLERGGWTGPFGLFD